MEKKKVSAKELAGDVKSRLSHRALREKHGLAPSQLDRLLDRLVEAGLITREEAPRNLSGRIIETFKCPACGAPQTSKRPECSQCGVILASYEKKAAKEAPAREAAASEKPPGAIGAFFKANWGKTALLLYFVFLIALGMRIYDERFQLAEYIRREVARIERVQQRTVEARIQHFERIQTEAELQAKRERRARARALRRERRRTESLIRKFERKAARTEMRRRRKDTRRDLKVKRKLHKQQRDALKLRQDALEAE